MNLASCNNCAVVLDKDKMKFASDIYDDNDCIDEEIATYNDDTSKYEAFVPCPICCKPVFKSS